MNNQNFNPELLVIARESRGKTQSDLAVALDMSQANISKIESGMLSISDDQLRKVAEVLRYPESFFFQDSPRHGFASNCIYHRKRQSAPVHQLRKLIAQLQIYRLQVMHLLRSVDVESDNRFHRMDIADYGGSPELIAQIVRRSWGLPPGPVQNLTTAIENAGGIVIKCSFGTNKVDAMSLWAVDMPPLIFINSEIPGDRLRYSLAHEIAHILMHQVPTNNMEKEADKFAAEFLMPKAEIAPFLTRLSIAKLANLKPYWKVSMAALLMRASDLKKLTDRQKQYFWTQMGKLGYRLKEPVDIPIEEPSVIRDIIKIHLDDLGYSVSELSQIVHSEESAFRSMYLQAKNHNLRIVGGNNVAERNM